MKKTMTKLVLKREMIRTLDRMQLEGIRGGGDDAAARADSGNGAGCPGLMDTGNGGGCPGRPDHKPAVGG
ncbi:MAG TPA: hypothetical protein VHT91_48210 [Kofleriaceae bacterium]|jgi:hypothetical protein|nr:hypothetical protein [Kofleriaceae bacterium]